MLSWEPKHDSRALLIGFSKYPLQECNVKKKFPPEEHEKRSPNIPAVCNNIEDLKNILINPNVIGLPEENVQTIVDKGDNATIKTTTYNIGQLAKNTLFVYFAGHGLISAYSKELYLATSKTNFDAPDYSGIPVKDIHKAIHESPAKTKIFILDCCFSGRGIKGALAAESSILRSNINIQGTYAIASAPANKPAIAPPGARYTAFSKELISILNEGKENAQDTITLKDVFDSIREELLSNPSIPDPEQAANNIDPNSFLFAFNRRFRINIDQRLSELRSFVDQKFSEYDKHIQNLIKSTSEIVERKNIKEESFYRSEKTAYFFSISLALIGPLVTFLIALYDIQLFPASLRGEVISYERINGVASFFEYIYLFLMMITVLPIIFPSNSIFGNFFARLFSVDPKIIFWPSFIGVSATVLINTLILGKLTFLPSRLDFNLFIRAS